LWWGYQRTQYSFDKFEQSEKFPEKLQHQLSAIKSRFKGTLKPKPFVAHSTLEVSCCTLQIPPGKNRCR
jgi:hypothetical protein